MIRVRSFSFVMLFSLLTGCSLPGLSIATPTLIPSSTSTPVPTSSPTNTPEPSATFTEVPSSRTPVNNLISFTLTPALPIAITLEQINARSGPASSFSSYGLIEEKQPVTILGQTLNGIWFQIQYQASPTGVAWVAADYVRVMKSIKGLPIFDNDGSPLP